MTPGEFLTLLWTERPPGLVQLWTLEGRRSRYIQAPQAADAIAKTNPADLYTGVAVAHRDHGRHHRATNDQALGIAGVWLDVDVDGGPEGKTGAAPSMADALALTGAILPPTLIVNSGYGLHAWWLFEEPWKFAGFDEQRAAAIAAAQWQKLHRDQVDYSVDSTHDLARLLRLPGTVNAKGGQQAPVEVIAKGGPRHSRGELLGRCATAGPITLATTELADVAVGRDVDAQLIERLMRNPDFEATFAHDRPDKAGWTWSEYDLALCSIAARMGASDQELADVIAYHGAHYSNAKGQRADYVQRTVAKARAGQSTQREEGQATYTNEQWADHLYDMLNRADDGAIPMPFDQLTEAMDGGLRPGEVCLVAGYTSHGKSVLVDQIADVAAESGSRVHLYMTEMTAYQRGLRMLARRAGVPFRKLKRRDLDAPQWRAITGALNSLPYGCSIVADWNVDQVVDHIRVNKWDLAVIDLVHGFHYTDERDLSKASSAMVRAAKGVDSQTAVVAAAHLNDGQMRDQRSNCRPRPGLHSIKGSSSLKQDADVVMFVWQQDSDDGAPSGEGAVWIAKCRQGELRAVKVRLDTGRMRFAPMLEVAA